MGGQTAERWHWSYSSVRGLTRSRTGRDASAQSVPVDCAPARSVLRAGPAYVLLATVIANSISFADPDLWGHIRFGQAVLHSHGLITRDVYSYSAAGHPWHNHELGFELLEAALYGAFGVLGLRLLKLLLSGATIVLIAVAQGQTEAGPVTQRWVLLLTALGLAPQVQFRPQLVSFALTAALIALLARSTYRRSNRHLWLAVPIMAAWANFHGGYVVAFGILATYCATALFSKKHDRGFLPGAARSLALLCACGLATLANPYGAGVWGAVARALSNPVTRSMVGEWRPMFLRFADQLRDGSPVAFFYLLALVMMGTFVVTVILAPRGADAPLVAVAGLMIASALYATRNIALALIALSVPLTRHLAILQRQRSAARISAPVGGWRPELQPRPQGALSTGPDLSPALHLPMNSKTLSPSAGRAALLRTNQLFAVACAVALAWESELFSRSLKAAPAPFPAGVVDFMRRNSLKGNLLCHFAWGEYLIWHTAPKSRVFIDGRYDTVYPRRVILDYLRLYFALPGATQVLTAYPHDFAIVPRTAKAYGLLRGQRGWRLIYQDEGAAMFAREGAAGNLPEIGPANISPKPSGADSFP